MQRLFCEKIVSLKLPWVQNSCISKINSTIQLQQICIYFRMFRNRCSEVFTKTFPDVEAFKFATLLEKDSTMNFYSE